MRNIEHNVKNAETEPYLLLPIVAAEVDWLLKQSETVWLAVEITRSWKRFFFSTDDLT